MKRLPITHACVAGLIAFAPVSGGAFAAENAGAPPVKTSLQTQTVGCNASNEAGKPPPKKKIVTGGIDNGSLSTYRTASNPCGGAAGNGNAKPKMAVKSSGVSENTCPGTGGCAPQKKTTH